MELKESCTELWNKTKTLGVDTYSKSKNKFNSLNKKKKIMVIVSLALIFLLLIVLIFKGNGKENTKQTYVETQATVGNITETIEQSGVVEPYERYEIISLVKGEIISSPVEEGDVVEEGDTLYQIDDEDAQLNIEKSYNNLEKSQISLNEKYEDVANLNIYAPASGKLTDFSLKIGDSVGNGVIGKINNTEKLAVDIPFSTSDYDKISVGDRVTATSALYMTTLSGTVSHKYTANANSGYEGSIVKNVEIEIDNPGALAQGTTFAATVHTSSGDVNSAGSGVIEEGTTTSVKSQVSGEVVYLAVKEGDYVQKGQLIAKLENESLVNSVKNGELSLKDSQLSLKSSEKTLENYHITAPISGTVITKNSKAGDKIDNSNSQTVMMVIADISKMKFTITVDELDIADIKLGQSAIVNADAIPYTNFEARVTSISSEGVSSGDGVTTFTVELTIDEPGELKSGMNVNANIVINEAYNVVTIPEQALMSVRGTSATVLVKSDKGNKNKKTDTKNEQVTPTMGKGGEGQMPPTMREGGEGQMPPTMGDEDKRPMSPTMGEDSERKMPQSSGSGNEMPAMNSGQTPSAKMPNIPNMPDGYEIRNVVIGISDGANVEVVSGIEEGEIVAYIPTTSTSTSFGFPGMMGGGMMGGMMGGGMPGGSGGRTMGGGMPGGSGGRMPSGR